MTSALDREERINGKQGEKRGVEDWLHHRSEHHKSCANQNCVKLKLGILRSLSFLAIMPE